MSNEEYIKWMHSLREGTDFPPSKPILKTGLNLLESLRNSPLFVPIVQNTAGFKGPWVIGKKGLSTKYIGKRVLLQEVEGKGIYSRLEELFQMSATVCVTGVHTIEYKFQNGVSRCSCYVVQLSNPFLRRYENGN